MGAKETKEILKLSKKERLILFNQNKILQQLGGPCRDTYKRNCEILKSGYTTHYSSLFWPVEDEEALTVKEQEDISAILEMYNSALAKHGIQFGGFDRLYEHLYYEYSKFLLDGLNFKNLKRSYAPTSRLPGHPNLDKYRRQLEEFKKLDTSDRKNQYDLTKEEALKITRIA